MLGGKTTPYEKEKNYRKMCAFKGRCLTGHYTCRLLFY